MLWRLIKVLFYLTILAGVALIAYAYAGPVFFPADFAAPSAPISQSVTLEFQ